MRPTPSQIEKAQNTHIRAARRLRELISARWPAGTTVYVHIRHGQRRLTEAIAVEGCYASTGCVRVQLQTGKKKYRDVPVHNVFDKQVAE